MKSSRLDSFAEKPSQARPGWRADNDNTTGKPCCGGKKDSNNAAAFGDWYLLGLREQRHGCLPYIHIMICQRSLLSPPPPSPPPLLS